MSSLCGLTFQLKEPTPNKPEKVINIMVDAEGERYINYLQNQLQQKENIIKEVREKIKNHLYAKTILSDMYSDNEIFEFILEKIGDIDE